jgi:hypothetical protein
MRYSLGTMKGIFAPEGTILGPKDITREWLVSLGTDEIGTRLGYATEAEIQGGLMRCITGQPQSVAEARML